MYMDHGLEGTLSGHIYIVKYPLSLFYIHFFCNSRVLILFRFPLQNKQKLCEVWCICMGESSDVPAGRKPLPVPTPYHQPAGQTPTTVLQRHHCQRWQSFLFIPGKPDTHPHPGKEICSTQRNANLSCVGAASPHSLQQSGHSQSHQDQDFLLGVDHKDSVDKTICYLFISMNLELEQW